MSENREHESLAFRKKPLKERIALRERVSAAHPETVPVIVSSPDATLSLQKWRYLVPTTHRMAMLYYEIQRHSLGIASQDSIFYLVSDAYHKSVSVPGTQTVGQVYEQRKDIDGFLYILVMRESTFG